MKDHTIAKCDPSATPEIRGTLLVEWRREKEQASKNKNRGVMKKSRGVSLSSLPWNQAIPSEKVQCGNDVSEQPEEYVRQRDPIHLVLESDLDLQVLICLHCQCDAPHRVEDAHEVIEDEHAEEEGQEREKSKNDLQKDIQLCRKGVNQSGKKI